MVFSGVAAGVSLSLVFIVGGLFGGVLSGAGAGLALLLIVLGCWVFEVTGDSECEGGSAAEFSIAGFVLLFIFSEFMFVLSCLVSAVGLVEWYWADLSLESDFQLVPVYISVVLLSSGVSVTCGHMGLEGNKVVGGMWMLVTAALAGVFMGVQISEWGELGFSVVSGSGGSLFYLITGFHGLHVFIGAVLVLLLGLAMVVMSHMGGGKHAMCEGVIWYWHFVDVVWLMVLVMLYWYCL